PDCFGNVFFLLGDQRRASVDVHGIPVGFLENYFTMHAIDMVRRLYFCSQTLNFQSTLFLYLPDCGFLHSFLIFYFAFGKIPFAETLNEKIRTLSVPYQPGGCLYVANTTFYILERHFRCGGG